MKACNIKILELFYNAKHTGRISKPDAVARVGEDDEGLVIELTWRVIGGVIADAKFRAFANPNAIAITSLMVDNMIGKSVEDVLTMGEEVIIDNLGEFLPEYLEVYDIVRECISEAYNNYLKRQNKKDDEVKEFDYDEYLATHPLEEGEEFDFIKLQRELQGGEPSRRGRPRKPVDPNAIVEVGEKRGRGRPRKEKPEVDENVEVVKRGRGRPRKEVDPNEEVEIGEKRGRGRPRKVVDESVIIEVGEKRGRGRPRKPVDPNAIVEVGEKRGRGRPRKPVDPNAVIEVGEKRGRGRPRKEVDPNEVVEVGEKRGRGRPRKPVDPNVVIEITEKRGRGRPRKEEVETDTFKIVAGVKRGRGRPKKEIKYNFPSDLGDVVEDEELDILINGKHKQNSDNNIESNVEIENQNETKQTSLNQVEAVYNNETNNLLDEDDDMFEADYDLFKSNIRNILSGKEVNNQNYNYVKYDNKTDTISAQKVESVNYFAPIEEDVDDKEEVIEEIDNDINNAEEVKRGRGRPRKEVDLNQTDEGEKRGRGRPKKIVIEEVADEHSSNKERQRVEPINSLTRSLNPAGMANRSNQDIVFASKNVTTTNININVTKTTTSVEDNKATSDDYSHSTNISQQKVEITLPTTSNKRDDEIDIEPVDTKSKQFDDDDDDFVDDSNIKDEAPMGGIEDLLKALLDD